MVLAKTIKKAREERGLTRKRLAELVGVNEKTVSQWENWNRIPHYSTFRRLCKTLGLNENELLRQVVDESKAMEATDVSAALAAVGATRGQRA